MSLDGEALTSDLDASIYEMINNAVDSDAFDAYDDL